MPDDDHWPVAASLLRATSQLVIAINEGVVRRGFPDVRPAHGFALVRISAGTATSADLAEHLGVSKQAASQLVEQLVQRGYVTRAPDPSDARARLLRLTERGWACTRAADAAAEEAIASWRRQLSTAEFAALQSTLGRVALPGPIRPSW